MERLKTLTWMMVCMSLFGCASLPDTNVQKMDGPLKADEGIVLAEVINNSKIITGVLSDWNELVMWKMDAEEGDDATFIITALKNPSSSFLFAGRLPEGHYRIGMLYAFEEIGDTSYSARALMPPGMGVFRVEPGQVTDLGTIVYHAFQHRSRFDRSMPDYAITRTPNPDLMETVHRSHPKVFSEVQTAIKTGWLSSDHDLDISDDFERMKASGLTNHHFPVDQDEFVLTGKLGAFYHFNNGQVNKIDVPTDREISSFTVTNNGEWMIGGEYGLLMKSSPPHQVWVPMSLSRDFNHIIDITTNDQGKTFVLSFDGELYNLYEYLGNDAFKKHRSFVNRIEFWYEDGMIPRMTLRDDRIEVSIDDVLYVMDLNGSGQWREEPVTEYLTINKQGNGIQITTESDSWSGFGPLLYSRDQGLSWQRLSQNKDVTPTHNRPYLFTDGTILTLQEMDKIKFLSKLNVYDEVKVKRSTDQGMTLKEIAQLPKGCETFAHNISTDDLIHVSCDNGELYGSNDRGESWHPVHVGYQTDFEDFSNKLKVPLSAMREK